MDSELIDEFGGIHLPSSATFSSKRHGKVKPIPTTPDLSTHPVVTEKETLKDEIVEKLAQPVRLSGNIFDLASFLVTLDKSATGDRFSVLTRNGCRLLEVKEVYKT